MEEKKDLADLLYERRKAILGAVVAIIVVIIAYGIVAHINQKKRERAAYLFSKGLQNLTQGLVKEDQDKLKKALEYFKKAKQVKAGKESVVAEAMEGRTLMALGKTEEGRKLIEEALSRMRGSHLEPVFAGATEDKELLKRFLQQDNPFLEDYARYELAMLYLKEGKKDKAIEELKTIKGKFPDSPFARDAERVLEVIR